MPLDLAGLMQLIAMSRAGRGPGMPDIAKSPSSVVATPMGRSALNDPHQIDPIAALQAPADMAAKQAQAQLLQKQGKVLDQFDLNSIFGGGATGGTSPGLGAAPTGMPQAPFTSFPPAPPASAYGAAPGMPANVNPYGAAPAPAPAPSAYPPDAGNMSAGGAITGAGAGERVAATLRSRGWSDGAIEGALNNGIMESSLNPTAKGAAGEIGLFQFHPKSHIGPFTKAYGGDWSPEAQANYVADQLDKSMPGYKSHTDGTAATRDFMLGFERPKDQSDRAIAARQANADASRGILARVGAGPSPQAPLGSATSAGRGVNPSTPPGPEMPERGATRVSPQDAPAGPVPTGSAADILKQYTPLELETYRARGMMGGNGIPSVPPGALKVGSNGEPYSPTLLNMSSQERANNDASYAALAGKQNAGGVPLSTPVQAPGATPTPLASMISQAPVQAPRGYTPQPAPMSPQTPQMSPMQAPQMSPQAAAPTQNPLMGVLAGIPPAPRGSGVNATALARGRMALALGGIQGDPLSGAAQLLYNSPEYLRQKAEQEGWGKAAPDLYTAQGKKQIELGALPQELGIRQQYAYGDPQNNPELQGRLAQAKTVYEKNGVLLNAGIDPKSPQGQAYLRNQIPDNRPEPVRMADAANLQGPQRDAVLQGAIPGNAPPASVKEYDAYAADQAKRGEPALSMFDWGQAQRKAGATNVQQHVAGQGQAAYVTAGIEAQKEGAAAAKAANQRTAQIGQLQEALKGFVPGATAEMRLGATRVLRDMGLISGDNVPSQEVFNQIIKQMQVHASPKGQGAVSNFERELFAQALPQMTNTPEAINHMLGFMLRLDDRDREVAQLRLNATDPQTGMPDFVNMQRAELALPPVLTREEMAGLAALRDRAAGKAPQAPGAAATAPPPAEKGMVHKGYRFLGGDPANPKSWAKVPE